MRFEEIIIHTNEEPAIKQNTGARETKDMPRGVAEKREGARGRGYLGEWRRRGRKRFWCLNISLKAFEAQRNNR